MIKMSKLMKECWAQNPKARLSMLRVKKTLHVMLASKEKEKEADIKMKYDIESSYESSKCWQDDILYSKEQRGRY